MIVGKNELLITFENKYGKDGLGIHSYTNSQNKQFIYTECEPYHFNCIAPVFDQPDLKGEMYFNINAPNDWIVVANSS